MEPLLQNDPLVAAFIAWLIAQALKIFTDFPQRRRLALHMWASSGGMPSSHSAIVTALAATVGMQQGFDSPLFAICFVFGSVVMYDATGVRRAAGHQARILNHIVAELFEGHAISQRQLKELIGHTPVQVIVGSLLGLVVALLWVNR